MIYSSFKHEIEYKLEPYEDFLKKEAAIKQKIHKLKPNEIEILNECIQKRKALYQESFHNEL